MCTGGRCGKKKESDVSAWPASLVGPEIYGTVCFPSLPFRYINGLWLNEHCPVIDGIRPPAVQVSSSSFSAFYCLIKRVLQKPLLGQVQNNGCACHLHGGGINILP